MRNMYKMTLLHEKHEVMIYYEKHVDDDGIKTVFINLSV